jgi:hypothetical protein
LRVLLTSPEPKKALPPLTFFSESGSKAYGRKFILKAPEIAISRAIDFILWKGPMLSSAS